MTNTINQPIEVRVGTLKAAIWTNTNADGSTGHSVTLSRRYRAKDGFKDSKSLNPTDLPAAAKLLEKAFDYLVEHAPVATVPSKDIANQG